MDLSSASPASEAPLRPFIHVNIALDAHGNAVGSDGRSLNISCQEDWQRVHLLRERYAAVAVGCRTWNLDRPQLTAREERLGRRATRQPARVIFCSGNHCALPADDRPTFHVGARPDRGGNVLHISAEGRSLRAPLRMLASAGIHDMLIEGGPTLLGSFFRDGCVDLCTFFVRTTDLGAAREALRRCTWLPSRVSEAAAPSRYGLGTLFKAEEKDLGAPSEKGLDDGRTTT